MLTKIIIFDLLNYISLVFLILIILVSSILLIVVTFKTRNLIFEKEKTFLEKNKLDIEWQNIILKKNILSNYKRIEDIAIKQLNMKHLRIIQKKIVIQQ